MDGLRIDRLVKQVSRRGLAAVLGGGLLVERTAEAAQGVGSCGGQPTSLTRFCRTAGACETEEDCAEGCACMERTISCCRKARRNRRRRTGVRRCVDGRPGLYCAPAG
jgi:hypothetical protein